MNIVTPSGQKLELDLSDPKVKAHVEDSRSMVPRLLQQINEEKIYEFIFKGNKNLTMLDIGANIGLVSLYASSHCQRIVALEPGPMFDILKLLCQKHPNIEPIQKALGPHMGSTLFNLNEQNPTASSAVQTHADATMMVSTIDLWSLIRQQGLTKIEFCKVDIEGSETDCLTPNMVERCKPYVCSYFVEVHNCPNSSWEWKLGKLTETFAHAGYRRMRIRGDSLFVALQ